MLERNQIKEKQPAPWSHCQLQAEGPVLCFSRPVEMRLRGGLPGKRKRRELWTWWEVDSHTKKKFGVFPETADGVRVAQSCDWLVSWQRTSREMPGSPSPHGSLRSSAVLALGAPGCHGREVAPLSLLKDSIKISKEHASRPVGSK